MDNLTHGLVGLIAGESIASAARAPGSALAPESRRGLLVTLSIIGSNLPDVDLVYSYHPFAHGVQAKLDYMLHHRGYTHTVLACFALAALLYGAVELWARWRHLLLTRHDRLLLAGASLFAVGLHLAMDSLNSYGVHPFWPLQDRWYYGDSVFIVEPLYWIAALPLFFVVRSRTARLFIALAPIFAVLVSVFLHLATPAWCIGYLLLGMAMLSVGARAPASGAALTSAGVVVAVTVLFIVAGAAAARRVDSIAAVDFSADLVIDHVLTPAPMNPVCWDVLLLGTRGDRYAVRLGVLSLLPALVPAQRCRTSAASPEDRSARSRTTAPIIPSALPVSAEIQWQGQFSISRTLLARVVGSHCRAAALMQFARAPFAAQLQGEWVMGDLRFDRARGSGMTSIFLGQPSVGECRSTVPWTPPRAGLLDLRP
jgi:inner membrane protein